MTRVESFGDRPLRVLYVDYSLNFGGAIKSLGLTLSELPHVTPFVLTSQDDEQVDRWLPSLPVWRFRRRFNYRNLSEVRNRFRRRVRAEFPGWAFDKALATADLGLTLRNAFRIGGLVRRHDIDLVHLNNGFTPPEALLATRYLRAPCVVHLRDFHLDRSRASRAGVEAVSHVITVSDSVARSLDDLPISPGRITTIHDPVDLTRIDDAASAREPVRRQCGIAEGEVAMGIFGRVVRWKGHLEFVDAAAAAMRQHGNIRAVIVGDRADGDREYYDAVQARIGASGVADRFHLAGYQADVERFYAAMDLVVHASITPEPFGMVVPEGLAAGKPVIAAAAGGPVEVVTHGVDGLLVPPGDVPGLADAMMRLAGDAAMRASMGEQGRRKARDRFGVAAQGRRIRQLYEQVLAAPASEAAR